MNQESTRGSPGITVSRFGPFGFSEDDSIPHPVNSGIPQPDYGASNGAHKSWFTFQRANVQAQAYSPQEVDTHVEKIGITSRDSSGPRSVSAQSSSKASISLAAEILKDGRGNKGSKETNLSKLDDAPEMKGFHARLKRRKEGQISRRSSVPMPPFESFVSSKSARTVSHIPQKSGSFLHEPTEGHNILIPEDGFNQPPMMSLANTSALRADQGSGRSVVEDESDLNSYCSPSASSSIARTKSSVMIEAFQEMELERTKMKSQLEGLRSRVYELEQENTAVSSRMQETKEKAVMSIKKAAEQVEHMNSQLESLREQTISSTLVETMRQSMVEVSGLRESVQSTITELSSLATSNTPHVNNALTRSILHEIQEDTKSILLENSNKQHVLDMLRDRLEIYTGDLAESKERIMTLEEDLRSTREVLQKSNATLISTSTRTAELAGEIQLQQSQTADALRRSAELEQKLTAASERLQFAIEKAQTTDIDHQATLSALQVELQDQRQINENFKSMVDQLGYQLLASQESNKHLQNEIDQCVTLRDEVEKSRQYEASLAVQTSLVKELREQAGLLPRLEATLKLKDSEIDKLNSEIVSARETVHVLGVKAGVAEHLQNELDSANAQLNQFRLQALDNVQLEKELSDSATLLKLEKDVVLKLAGEKEESQRLSAAAEKNLRETEFKLQRSNTRFETLEIRLAERDEASSLMQAGLKERLQRYESQLQSSNSELIASASRAALLEKTVQDMEKIMEARLEELQQTKALSDARLAELSATNELLFRAQTEVETRTSALNLAEVANIDLKKQVEDVHNTRSIVSRSIEETSVLSRISREELSEAQKRIEVLQRDLSSHKARLEQATALMSTLPTRCTNAQEMNAEEAALVGKLMCVCRSFYEKELAEKGNSVRRRDNVIREKDQHIKEIEELLAKAQSAAQNRSDLDCSQKVASSLPSGLTPQIVGQINELAHDITVSKDSMPINTEEACTRKQKKTFAALDIQVSEDDPVLNSDDAPLISTVKTPTTCNGASGKASTTYQKKRSKRSTDESDYIDEDEEIVQKRGKRGKTTNTKNLAAQEEKSARKQRSKRRH